MKTEHEQYLVTHHLFRVFIRSQYKGIDWSNDECDEVGIGFAEYLDQLNLTHEQKKNILPISEVDVVMNLEHPLRMNGFHAAYVLHFTRYVEKVQKEAV